MAISNNVPVFLDSGSGFEKNQVEFINTLVRTSRRSFEAKAKQVMKPKPDITHLAEAKYNRVLDFKDYLYNDYFTLAFILDPTGFVKNGTYNLFETNKSIRFLNGDGSNSDVRIARALMNLGTFVTSFEGNKTIVQFKMTADDWPKDADDNPVKYSVCVWGRIND